MSEPAISARNISVTFVRRGSFRGLRRNTREPDAVHALRDVSFEVRHGEAFGIIGPNGAGKSTLMRVIGQTLVPDAGELTVRGATSTLLQLGVGFNPQLDGSRNILLGLLAAGLSRAEVDEVHDQIWEYSELGDALFRPLATYSRGMQSRLAFAIATFIEAEILLVDEVLAVGDESFKQKSLATMRTMLEDAGTIVMVSHALGTVQEFCDRVMWLEDGAIRQIGDPATVVGAYRNAHTLGDVRLVRATRATVDQEARPLDVRRPEPLDTDVLRAKRKAEEPADHVDLAPPTPARAATRRGRKLLDRGWRVAKGQWLSLTPPIDWPDERSGAAQRALMAWEPVATLLAAHSRAADPRWVQAAVAIAIDWSRRYPTIDRSPVWDAETTALRASRLASLIDHAAADPLLSDPDLGELTVLAQIHGWALADDDRYAARDIDGLHQIAAGLALAERVPELPIAEQLERTSRRRLREFIDHGQAADGVWRSHTPTFHAAVTEQLTRMIDSGLADDRATVKARNKAERALAWFVMPDGSLPGFGEATTFGASRWMAGAEKPSLGAIKRRWRTGPMRAAASAGRAGATPTDTTHVFGAGGYVVLRNRWPDRPLADDATFIALMAGRHSTERKHADDLSFVWFDAGRHLLVDAGAYAGPSDDPHRRYVTSARAHNTVEIDGADQFPGAAFGSGARQAGALGTLRYGSGRATFGDGIVFRRVVVVEPGAWLLVIDLLRDRAGSPHEFRQWFHPAADLDATEAPGGTVILRGNDGVEIHASSLSAAALIPPVRGLVEPRQGWVSPTDRVIEPAWAFGWKLEPTALGGFVTLLSLRGPAADFDAELASAHQAHVRFRAGGELYELAVDTRNDRVVERR